MFFCLPIVFLHGTVFHAVFNRLLSHLVFVDDVDKQVPVIRYSYYFDVSPVTELNLSRSCLILLLVFWDMVAITSLESTCFSGLE